MQRSFCNQILKDGQSKTKACNKHLDAYHFRPRKCVCISFETAIPHFWRRISFAISYTKTLLSLWTSQPVSQSTIMLTGYAFSNVSNVFGSVLVSRKVDWQYSYGAEGCFVQPQDLSEISADIIRYYKTQNGQHTQWCSQRMLVVMNNIKKS